MMINKYKGFNSSMLIAIFTFLFIVLGFAYYGISKSAEIEPEVILIRSDTYK